MRKIFIGTFLFASLISHASECKPVDAENSAKKFLSETYEISNELKATALSSKDINYYTVVYTYTEEIVGYVGVSNFSFGGFLFVDKSNCKVAEDEMSDSGVLN